MIADRTQDGLFLLPFRHPVRVRNIPILELSNVPQPAQCLHHFPRSRLPALDLSQVTNLPTPAALRCLRGVLPTLMRRPQSEAPTSALMINPRTLLTGACHPSHSGAQRRLCPAVRPHRLRPHKHRHLDTGKFQQGRLIGTKERLIMKATTIQT